MLLGDAAGFSRDNVGFSDVVEQRRFAVINVTHDDNDGRSFGELCGFMWHRKRYVDTTTRFSACHETGLNRAYF